MANNLGIQIGIQEEQKEKAETLLTIRKRCGTLIEGDTTPYKVYRDTATQPDSFYRVGQKEKD